MIISLYHHASVVVGRISIYLVITHVIIYGIIHKYQFCVLFGISGFRSFTNRQLSRDVLSKSGVREKAFSVWILQWKCECVLKGVHCSQPCSSTQVFIRFLLFFLHQRLIDPDQCKRSEAILEEGAAVCY